MSVIRVDNLSKLYRLGARRHNSLRDALVGFFKRGGAKENKDELWALRGVSFLVEDGETLGLIGRNGAGKSTLLKILSRITRPTSGEAEIRGRVGSLLEVGTGFHNELTGRENIFLNGAILGMRHAEIREKFDEIVAFSEVERFLETPVKHYSSGMYMRLAFAVAAHLDPEVLIVDEVLAVGDIAFQKKCLSKMNDLGRTGRTVIFVSHNLPAVTRLCRRAIWLDRGRVREAGPAAEIVDSFQREQTRVGSENDWEASGILPAGGAARLLRARAASENLATTAVFDIRRPIVLELKYEVTSGEKPITPTFHIYNEDALCVFVTNDLDPAWNERPRPPGVYTSRAVIPGNFMAEGSFLVTVAVFSAEPFEEHVRVADAFRFQVVDSLKGGTARGNFGGAMLGAVRPVLSWETKFEGKG